MFLDDIKQNINKVDTELKKLFENVYITEKADKQSYYVEISCNKVFLFEGCKKRVEVKAYINKDNLKFDTIKWSYSLNPLVENANRIERISTINNLAKDIYDIADNKRMVNEYFNSLDAMVDLICEEYTHTLPFGDASNPSGCIPFGGLNFIPVKVRNIADKVSKYVSFQGYTPHDTYIEFRLQEKMSMVDKFSMEKELLTDENVNFISFGNGEYPGGTLKVTLK